MWRRRLLFVIFCVMNHVIYGVTQDLNGALYIPSIPSNGGLEPGEVIEAELLGAEGGTSTFRLFDSLPTVVGDLQTRTTATFTLVSAPSAALLAIDVDRKIGQNNVKEDIRVQCFIDVTGRSVCEDLIVEAIDQQRTTTVTSLFSEMTSAVPVIAIGFGSSSSTSPTATNSSNATTPTSSNNSTNSTLTAATLPTLPPLVSAPSSSDDGVTTVTITPGATSPTGDTVLTSSASTLLNKSLLSFLVFALTAMCCSV